MPEPIKQEIHVDYNGEPLKKAIEDQKHLKDGVEKTGETSDRATTQTRQLSQATDKLTNESREATRAQKQYADQADDSGNRTNFLTGMISKVTGALGGFVSGIIGGFGINEALDAYNRRVEASNRLLEENAQRTREAAQARLDLIALSGFESPEKVAFLDQAAALSGRSQSEVARVQTLLESRFPNADKAQLEQLGLLTAAQGQLTEAPLSSLADPLASLFDLTKDPVKASNLLNAAIDQAGEPDPAKLGPLIAKFAAVGTSVGGLDAGESTGFAAAATGLGLVNESAVTGLVRLTLGIRGKGTPEGSEVLEREGINTDSLPQALQQIIKAYREGRIKREELESIGGAEGLPVLGKLAADQQVEADFFAKVAAVNAAEDRDTLILADKSQGAFKSDIQRLNLLAKQEEAKLGSIQASDVGAVRGDAAKAIIARILAEAQQRGELTAYDAEQIQKSFDRGISKGYDPKIAANLAEFTSNVNPITGPLIELSDPLLEALDTGPQLITGGRGQGTRVVNYNTNYNIGQQYNLTNQDGTTHKTEMTGRADLP